MKKLFIFVLCAAMMVSLAACGSNQSNTSNTTDDTQSSDTSDDTTTNDTTTDDTAGDTQDDGTEIANPFITCETLEDAAALAGFDMAAPNLSSDTYAQQEISAIEDTMIQISYQDTDGTDAIVIRKGTGSDDISGDYNTYDETGTLDVDGITVTTKGNDGLIYVATWTSGDFTFSITATAGLDSDGVTELVQAVQ